MPRPRSRSPERSRREDYYDRPSRDSGRSRYRSRSRSPAPRDRERRRRRDDSREPGGSGSTSRPSQVAPVSPKDSGSGDKGKHRQKDDDDDDDEDRAPIQTGPNFGLSGKLAAETNTVKGVVLKYNEPPEARKPNKSWRLYVFKGKEQLDMFHINRQSCYLLGRDRLVADIPIEHPSTSKQHAVIQYRQVYERNEFGDQRSLTKPFIIDLESANGTVVNDDKLPESRYYELRSGDVIKFAFSTREYVILAES